MSPFEAVYGRPPSFGLASLNVPKEHWNVPNDEDDLLEFQQPSLVDPIIASLDELSHLSKNEVPTNELYFEPQSPYLSKFPPIPDAYEASISHSGTIVNGIEYNNYIETLISSNPIILEDNSGAIESDYNLLSEEQVIMEQLSTSPSGDSVMSTSPTTTTTNLLCAVCDNETSGAHSCPGCKRFVHVPCEVLHGEEEFSSSVWCQSCLLKEKNISTQHLIKGIKRNQEKLHDRMLKSSNKKFKPAEISDTVLMLISQPDKMSSIGPRKLVGHIIEAQDSVYTVSTSHGTISIGYARNQFDECPFKISAY